MFFAGVMLRSSMPRAATTISSVRLCHPPPHYFYPVDSTPADSHFSEGQQQV